MPADLFVYALVAAGLLFWLRNVLGTRHGEERERSNPFLSSDNSEDAASEKSLSPSEDLGPEDQILAFTEDSDRNIGVDNKTAENALIEIARADKNFDIKFFLQGAQDAFALIVESFAEGDRETLKNLLGAQVYAAFDGGIAEREERKETQETEIHAIRKALITEAKLDGKMAYITVKFIADETSVTRDENGEIIAGHPDKTTKMHDIWTFGRDIKSKNPAWLVYETRGGFDEDNDLIPDTH